MPENSTLISFRNIYRVCTGKLTFRSAEHNTEFAPELLMLSPGRNIGDKNLVIAYHMG